MDIIYVGHLLVAKVVKKLLILLLLLLRDISSGHTEVVLATELS
jgi:hypothetical protein